MTLVNLAMTCRTSRCPRSGNVIRAPPGRLETGPDPAWTWPSRRNRDLEAGALALHLAASNGQEAVVQALLNRADFADLLQAVDKDGFTALHAAAFRGHLGIVQALIRCPTVTEDWISACGVFDVARPEGHWAREAAEIYDMNTALHMAAAMGHSDICALLLIHGPRAANKAGTLENHGPSKVA
eukprot:Skav228961  [mRNA]  locus=scaffold3906:56886:62987:+ [translate_table: standard]